MEDLRVTGYNALLTPAYLQEELPAVRILFLTDAIFQKAKIFFCHQSKKSEETVHSARQEAAKILRGEDDRLIIIVGPCSIHDVDAAKDYCKCSPPTRIKK